MYKIHIVWTTLIADYNAPDLPTAQQAATLLAAFPASISITIWEIASGNMVEKIK